MRFRFFPMLVVGLVLGYSLGAMFTHVYRVTLEVAAGECATLSNGTDKDVAECYESRHLKVPR